MKQLSFITAKAVRLNARLNEFSRAEILVGHA